MIRNSIDRETFELARPAVEPMTDLELAGALEAIVYSADYPVALSPLAIAEAAARLREGQ